MLQQTRVETVIPYFERFLARFPTPVALAEASEGDVLGMWSGLGYYRRARLLHAGAKHAAERGMPDDREGLLELPGIGRYTAGAIASIAFNRAVGLVDGNVARVLARVFGMDDDMKRSGMRRAEALADALVAQENPGAWNQALMELGATICAPRSPGCDRCPIATQCVARAEGRVDALPVLSEKTKPKAQRVQSLVARDEEGRVLLARRRTGGLFGGLWEPPSIDGGPKARAELLERIPVRDVERRGAVTHVLSHRRLTVDVHSGVLAGQWKSLPEVYEAAELFDAKSIAASKTSGLIALATLAHKVLAK